MDTVFYFKNFEPTDAIKSYINDKVDKIKNRLHHIEGIDVRLSILKQKNCFEVVIHADCSIFHVSKSEKDMYMAIDTGLDTIQLQIDRYHKKNDKRNPKEVPELIPLMLPGSIDSENYISIYDASPKPMDDNEAIMQVRANKYRFLMYRHVNEERYSLIMVRPDGNYSIISPLEKLGEYRERVVSWKKDDLKELMRMLYPMSRFKWSEAIDVLKDNHLEFIAFINDETSRLNVLFHGKNGSLVVKRPTIIS